MRLLMIDFKRTEFRIFGSLPHLWVSGVNEMEDAVVAAGRLAMEMGRRMGFRFLSLKGRRATCRWQFEAIGQLLSVFGSRVVHGVCSG